MSAATDPLVSYTLAEDGPVLFNTPPCWWCTGDAHPRGWRGCPLVVVPIADLSPTRRRLRDLLS